MHKYPVFVMIAAMSIGWAATTDLAIAEKKKKVRIAGCTVEQIKKYSGKCSPFAGLSCEGNTVSCCNAFEDELGLPEGFCIVVSEGRGSRPGIERANPLKKMPDLTAQ